MRALVLGLGASGKAALRFLEKRGIEVLGVDDRLAPCELKTLQGFDLFVPSPGIPRSHPLYQLALIEGIPMKGEMQLFLEEFQGTCIGVTGTNGKTTVVSMIAHVLNRCGHPAKAVGNIGVPLCEIEGGEILVIEMSSFQLETLSVKVLDVGLILNIAEDHLDRYESFAEYARTKVKMERCMKSEGKLFVHESVDSKLFVHPRIPFSGHNREATFHACMALGISREDTFSALESFTIASHRIELVEKIGATSYYNDSKATNVAAVVNALKQVGENCLLILGGQDKGLSFSPLLEERKRFSTVIAYGQAREKIASSLKPLVDVVCVETLDEAVQLAKGWTTPVETVLFSPGCASFDAFKNYEQRGERFKQLVRRRE